MDEEQLKSIIESFSEITLEGDLKEQLLSVLNYWRCRAKFFESNTRNCHYHYLICLDQLRFWDEFRFVLLQKLNLKHPHGMPLDELVFPVIDEMVRQNDLEI